MPAPSAPRGHKPRRSFDYTVVDVRQPLQPSDRSACLGARTLRLISQRWMIAILLELCDGPLRPHELERRLPALSHAGLMRRLSELAHAGAVRHERSREIPPRAHYTLTRAGEELLTIADRAARWEEHAQLGASVPGAWALRLLADERTLAILRELAFAPGGPRELGRRLPGVAHAVLMRRLSQLTADGLLERSEQQAGVRYALEQQARSLAALVVLAMGWERASAPGVEPAPASDLLGMLRLIAPLADVAPELRGVCRLRVDAHGERESSLCLLVADGRLSVAPLAAHSPRHALACATLDGWLRALLNGTRGGGVIAVVDPPLAVGVVSSLAGLLRARRLDSLFELLKIA